MAEKIMVVDDDLDTLRLVGLMLERQGFQIVAATTGGQALALAKTEKPTLVILDLMMPDMDGLSVARQLRAAPETKDILIVMFTAKGQTDDKLEGFDAGADAYLTKPTQPRELVAQVRAVLKRAGRGPATGPLAKVYGERGQTVAILAAKGGVGVTTLASNLAVALHQQTKKPVVLADFRPGCGTLGLELGFTNIPGLERLFSVDVAAIGPEILEGELVEHTSGVRCLLSSPRPHEAQYFSAANVFAAIAYNLAYLGQQIVLDLGPGATPVNEKVLEHCNRVILAVEPVPQTVQQSRLLYEHLVSIGIGEDRLMPVLYNRLRAGMQLSLGQVQDLLGRSIPSIFTAAPELAYQAQVANTPMILRQPDGITTQQFNALAEKIVKRTR